MRKIGMVLDAATLGVVTTKAGARVQRAVVEATAPSASRCRAERP
ncbi:MAG TPA: hypothetical protein VIL69_17330 [Roseomonas sp.]